MLLLLFCLLGNQGFGQVYFDELYESGIVQTQGQGIWGDAVKLDSGYVFQSFAWETSTNTRQLWLVQTDLSGQVVHSAFHGDTNDYFSTKDLIRMSNNYLGVSSYTDLNNSTLLDDFALIHYGSDLIVDSVQYFGYEHRDELAHKLIMTSDGGFLIAGQSSDSTFSDGDVYVVKTDSSGIQEWELLWGGNEYDGALDVCETTDGGFLVLGFTRSFGAIQRDFLLLKITSDGTVQWHENYDSGDEIGWSIVPLLSGNYLLSGGGDYDNITARGYLYEVDLSGQVMWHEKYESGDFPADFIFKSIQLADSSIVCAGLAENNSTGGNAGWLMKTESNGELVWQRVYDKNQYTDLFYSVLASDDNGFLLSGQAINDSTYSQDAWLLKVDSIGCPYPNCTVGIDELGSKDVLLDVWPNPANHVLNLEVVGNHASAPASVTVVDMQGRVVCKDQDCHGRSSLAMTGKTEIDVSNWPNGLYVLTLTTDKQQASVRVVVQH